MTLKIPMELVARMMKPRMATTRAKRDIDRRLSSMRSAGPDGSPSQTLTWRSVPYSGSRIERTRDAAFSTVSVDMRAMRNGAELYRVHMEADRHAAQDGKDDAPDPIGLAFHLRHVPVDAHHRVEVQPVLARQRHGLPNGSCRLSEEHPRCQRRHHDDPAARIDLFLCKEAPGRHA